MVHPSSSSFDGRAHSLEKICNIDHVLEAGRSKDTSCHSHSVEDSSSSEIGAEAKTQIECCGVSAHLVERTDGSGAPPGGWRQRLQPTGPPPGVEEPHKAQQDAEHHLNVVAVQGSLAGAPLTGTRLGEEQRESLTKAFWHVRCIMA